MTPLTPVEALPCWHSLIACKSMVASPRGTSWAAGNPTGKR